MPLPSPALMHTALAVAAAWPLVAVVPALAQEPAAVPAAWVTAQASSVPPAAPAPQPSPAAATVTASTGSEVAAPLALTVGKSVVVPLPGPIDRISIGNPAVLDVTMTGARELYLLGKAFGSSNVMLWRKGGGMTVMDVSVAVDTETLQQQLGAVLPGEPGIRVRAAADSIVLTGSVSSALKADHAVALAEGYARAYARPVAAAAAGLGMGGRPEGAVSAGAAGPGWQTATSPRVINLLSVLQPQQVMLEVKVAEVSRSLLDQFGISLNLSKVAGGVTYGLISARLQEVFGTLTATRRGNGSRATVDGSFDDGLVKILAEPSIVAVSGQEGSFLAGGKVFIPVARSNDSGGTTVTLEEKEYGVGLKFTPVVLDGDLIHLRVAPEVSELTRTGSPFVSTGGSTTVLPSFTTRRAQTSVQLRDGQSLAIAGLIKNNVANNVSRFPFLGEIPVLGALFRSSEFQTDRSELLFVITPRLVRTLPESVPLPTDAYTPPSRQELLLNGQLEGRGATPR